MSRTTRRKAATPEQWELYERVYDPSDCYYQVPYRGLKLKHAVKEWRRDGSKTWCKWQNNKYWRMMEHRTRRMVFRVVLRKATVNPDVEVLAQERRPMDYFN